MKSKGKRQYSTLLVPGCCWWLLKKGDSLRYLHFWIRRGPLSMGIILDNQICSFLEFLAKKSFFLHNSVIFWFWKKIYILVTPPKLAKIIGVCEVNLYSKVLTVFLQQQYTQKYKKSLQNWQRQNKVNNRF